MSFITALMEQNSTIGSSFTYLFSTFVSVFVMVDPFAAIPVYLLLTERFTPADVKKTRRKSILVASAILLTFAITGMSVLNFFGISISALRIAGGILLLKFALDHLKGDSEKIKSDEENESLTKDDISIVPLAMPLLAGPGAISTIVTQATRGKSWLDFLLLLIAIILVMWVTAIFLKYSQYLYRLLGKTGLNLMGKIMGILIAAIAVEFIIIGVSEAYKNLIK
ncbi:MarC family protein [Fluviispira vulneris]|uniref:MarC family protein n=1 Tax=Fluviispira vulneris TaxID=2763012 RepID=UPI00164538C7|nr:NAAT family transporter [Fluviispira vulneris]